MRNILLYIYIHTPQFLYPFICQWTSRLLPCPSSCQKWCDKHWGTRFSSGYGFPSSGIAGSYGSSFPSFLRTLHTVLHSGSVSLYSHQQCRTILFSSHPPQPLLFVVHIYNEYYSALKKRMHLSVLIRCMNLEPIVQWSQKEKHKHCILTRVYGV